MPTLLDVSCVLTLVTGDADARGEFGRLAMMCGWGHVDTTSLEVATALALDAADVAVARRFSGEIKSVLWASCDDEDIEAFAGTALVPVGNPVASSRDRTHHIHIAGTYRADSDESPRREMASARTVTAPVTEWFVRARFPGVAPHAEAVSTLFARVGLDTIAVVDDGTTQWRRVAAATRARVDSALGELRDRHRLSLIAIRAL